MRSYQSIKRSRGSFGAQKTTKTVSRSITEALVGLGELGESIMHLVGSSTAQGAGLYGLHVIRVQVFMVIVRSVNKVCSPTKGVSWRATELERLCQSLVRPSVTI